MQKTVIYLKDGEKLEYNFIIPLNEGDVFDFKEEQYIVSVCGWDADENFYWVTLK